MPEAPHKCERAARLLKVQGGALLRPLCQVPRKVFDDRKLRPADHRGPLLLVSDAHLTSLRGLLASRGRIIGPEYQISSKNRPRERRRRVAVSEGALLQISSYFFSVRLSCSDSIKTKRLRGLPFIAKELFIRSLC